LLKLSKILLHIIFLYCIYLLGNWIVEIFNLIIPGSVLGMIILFVLLLTNVIKVTWIEEGTKFVVDNLAFFFIPATVGIINYFDLFVGKGMFLILIVLFSTTLVIITSGLTSQWIMCRKERKHD